MERYRGKRSRRTSFACCSPAACSRPPLLWKQDRAAGDMTLYWPFLLGLTTGARLEKIGQAMVANVKTDDAITYIDIDDYAATDDEDKSIKTGTSRRLVPIHSNLLRLGFDSYLKALIAAGHTRLFPDLISN